MPYLIGMNYLGGSRRAPRYRVTDCVAVPESVTKPVKVAHHRGKLWVRTDAPYRVGTFANPAKIIAS